MGESVMNVLSCGISSLRWPTTLLISMPPIGTPRNPSNGDEIE